RSESSWSSGAAALGQGTAVKTVSAGSRNRPSQGAPAAHPAPRSAWIVGPWADAMLIIASPLLVIALLTAARGVWSPAIVSGFVMTWAIGHHLPGMMRAYGDPALFRRFRWRFILAPILLLAA